MNITKLIRWLSTPTVIGNRKLAQYLNPGDERHYRPDAHRYKSKPQRVKPPWKTISCSV